MGSTDMGICICAPIPVRIAKKAARVIFFMPILLIIFIPPFRTKNCNRSLRQGIPSVNRYLFIVDMRRPCLVRRYPSDSKADLLNIYMKKRIELLINTDLSLRRDRSFGGMHFCLPSLRKE